MKNIRILAFATLVASGVSVTAQAEEEIYNWRTQAGIEENDQYQASLNNKGNFLSQPGEIWNWREEEGVDYPQNKEGSKNYNDPIYDN